MPLPNIILFLTDQQRPDTVGALGGEHMITPQLDRLAQEGVSFDRCFCTAPSCVPSRASFFRCRYPHELQVYHNGCPWIPSWVDQLRDVGYHTVNVGKMHTVPMDAQCGFDNRFVVENKDRPLRLSRDHGGFYDEWDKFLNNSGVRKPSRHTYRSEHPQYETALGAYAWPLDEKYHSDVFVGNMAQWFLEQREAKSPLFLQVGFPGPHPPYDPPERLLAMYDEVDLPCPEVSEAELASQPRPHGMYREEMIGGNHDAVRWSGSPTPEQLLRLRRHYAANVTLIDEQVGRTLDRLRERGYLENAIVIFTSDHGDCLGDHGHIQKWTMYDCVTRVPAIAWAPGRLSSGKQIDGLIQQMDLVPMIFELAGLDIPEGSARSALSVVREEGTGRDVVFAEHTADNILRGVEHVTMVRTRQWKLVHYLNQGWGELYDLKEDPGERKNLWSSPDLAGTKQELISTMEEWRSATS